MWVESQTTWHVSVKGSDWISLPASVALPFGVFEKVLRSEANRAVDTEYGDLCRSLDGEPEKLDLLAGLREVILKMQARRSFSPRSDLR